MSFTPEAFAKFLLHEIGDHRVHEAELIALEAIGQMVEAEAKRTIGTYDFDWPQLAESTQQDRERKGYEANEPLLRTGELRDAIEHQVDQHEMSVEIGVPAGEPHSGTGATVGEIGMYQEFGTATIPPRPFLGPSLFYLLGNGAIQEVVKQTVGAVIAGNRLDHATLELVREVLKSLGNIAKMPIDTAERNQTEQQDR
jgi:hypothetical protein